MAANEVKKEKVHAYLKQNYPGDTLKWVEKAEWTEEEVPLTEIKMDRRPGGPRELDKVKRIAEAFTSGEDMEPVVLVKQADGTHKVADGYHRTLGCKHSAKKKIKAWVGRVMQEDGPWDKEMHARKLNVGKTAYETFDQFEKEAALIGGIARLGGKMIKSTGKELKNFGTGITGTGTRGAKKELDAVKTLGTSRTEIAGAKKNLRAEKTNQAKSWGIAGLGAAGLGVSQATNKLSQPDTFENKDMKQFDTFNTPVK